MEKRKRWQFYLIIAVMILTLYNIMPTIFYYSKPLKAEIQAPRAEEIALSIVKRVNGIEEESREWLSSFCKLLGIKPETIQLREEDPGLFEVRFASVQDAATFRRFLPRAGALIPFIPAQLELYPDVEVENGTVLVARQLDVHLNPQELHQLFAFSEKRAENGAISEGYQQVVYDRVSQLALGLGGPAKGALQMAAIADNGNDAQFDEMVLTVAREIIEVESSLGRQSPIAKRFYASFAQIDRPDAGQLAQKYVARAETLKANFNARRDAIRKEQKQQVEQGELATFGGEQELVLLNSNVKVLDSAIAIIQKNQALFNATSLPLTQVQVVNELKTTGSKVNRENQAQIINLNNRNPFVQALIVDWGDDNILFELYPDVAAIRSSDAKTEVAAFLKDKLQHFLLQEVARVSQLSDEQILSDDDSFNVQLNTLAGSQSILQLNLNYIAAKKAEQIAKQLASGWHSSHPDLNREAYPIYSFAQYEHLKPEEQKLGLVVYAPATEKKAPLMGFRTGSIYVIAKGLDAVMQKYRQLPPSDEQRQVMTEINQLASLLQQRGFIGYPGSSYGMDPAFRKDFIFELDDYSSILLKATREDFTVKGSKRFAVLDFTDVEQRILAVNKIDDRIQEDLLKSKEEYHIAQVDPNATSKYLVPAPTKNPYWENFKLSCVKYFRGDDRKILKWGLDLSGGKTVRIGLRDHSNRPVTDPNDLKQAVNELYARVNNMGVSERTIRIENSHIVLDFPGSQGVSAAELIKASAMSFHIVNEKFSSPVSSLKAVTTQFLQEVWNEAVVTNRKDIENVNLIAWQHLGGDLDEPASMRPISQAARELYENGLRIPNPKESSPTHQFDDTLSAIAKVRGDEITEWHGEGNPLMVVFYHYGLEGANLTNVQVGYDSTQGNLLNFSVKRSYESSEGSGNPREDFYAWTSQFAEDKIVGTPKEAYTKGQGWRMAVILNDQVISAPLLRAALRDGGVISGHFSQREVNQLAADLKAGSLSFTPRILSEVNVNPELGKEERSQGIIASVVALALVVIAMIGYYRFAGLVASCAVLLNIFIMWGVLQNIGAAITLPGIAGIVLTIGMAVDANVLVFERIREEFRHSGRIASAIQAGYRKAFSAIVDSNITTIIAALILTQFDSGPIKGFAVTLIIGILSSMFTALFMTRYFFAGWVQNPKNKMLNMAHWIGNTQINFLAYARKAILVSLVLMCVGTYAFVMQRKTLFGMDFTGGYSLTLELVENPSVGSYRLAAGEALMAHGATSNDFQIRELNKANQLRIQLGVSMEEKGHPFYQMPQEEELQGGTHYPFQNNPRIVWVVNALSEAGLQPVSSQLPQLQEDWSLISGQLSDAMRNNAIIALTIALFSILLYITFRFEFKFAVASIIGLVHDVIITLGLLALLHWVGLSVQIDLQVIGAIMTIIGYSLNDTIIVFDRIREDLHILRKLPFPEIINHALNVTLSRTLMTSGTTLLVLLTLVLLGGHSIFAFSVVMTLGVLVGTFSSLFIATPTLLYLHNRELKEQGKAIIHKV